MTEEPVGYKVLVYYKRSAVDKHMVGLPPDAQRTLLSAEAGTWDMEPGSALIQFHHWARDPMTGKRFHRLLGLGRADSPDRLPVLGSTILLNGFPFVVRKCDSEPVVMSCGNDEGTYEFHLITVKALNAE